MISIKRSEIRNQIRTSYPSTTSASADFPDGENFACRCRNKSVGQERGIEVQHAIVVGREKQKNASSRYNKEEDLSYQPVVQTKSCDRILRTYKRTSQRRA
ncbi:hypothetical protein PILCRDRAFT_739617 [Piloderma croceum F 1598]|uniref:Uncharacterized protein n=1 Tax=Piloderma croceum (strain F 1598) TaxID=765440 RepID=A0A0C3B5S5_PILCF|nr:hypothetical protein PILCRDRAFT_739617 [Piloderma croceum F 1598]